jgi:hypothetical protein
MFNTPILFIIFNRPDKAKEVFKKIQEIKPKQLFIAADGPRKNNPEDVELCKQTREILNGINWDCELKNLLREENVGCKKGPADAISWFFEHVEEGIILEDDCLPSDSFFPFCEELLEKYRYDTRIMHIGGASQLPDYENPDSYYFSRLPNVWGWATWKRAWQLMDLHFTDFEEFKQRNIIKDKVKNKYHRQNWINNFQRAKDSSDIWDYIWVYTLFIQNGLSIVPSKNLILNIGFDGQATHTSIRPHYYNQMKLDTLPENKLKHPNFIYIDEELQHKVQVIVYKMNPSFSFKRYPFYHKIKKVVPSRLRAKFSQLLGNHANA